MCPLVELNHRMKQLLIRSTCNFHGHEHRVIKIVAWWKVQVKKDVNTLLELHIYIIQRNFQGTKLLEFLTNCKNFTYQFHLLCFYIAKPWLKIQTAKVFPTFWQNPVNHEHLICCLRYLLLPAYYAYFLPNMLCCSAKKFWPITLNIMFMYQICT